uniref:Cyclin-dependent kinase inhibitor domain-containing protein n=1 Tax=Hippocampus comes TaxID=109280 RepID=A0A3Q2YL44_HIPCM
MCQAKCFILATLKRIPGLVRKCLFGTVDHDHVNRDLELKLHQISQEDTQRWNFIFKTETPLPGRLQWEKNPVDSVAAFYHESSWGENTSSATHDSTGSPSRRRNELNQREYIRAMKYTLISRVWPTVGVSRRKNNCVTDL